MLLWFGHTVCSSLIIVGVECVIDAQCQIESLEFVVGTCVDNSSCANFVIRLVYVRISAIDHGTYYRIVLLRQRVDIGSDSDAPESGTLPNLVTAHNVEYEIGHIVDMAAVGIIVDTPWDILIRAVE